MKRIKQARRDAKTLYQYCLVNELLDEERVRQVMQQLIETSNRNRLKVMSELRRLVKIDCGQHSATVESAVPIVPKLMEDVQGELKRLYGPGLTITFTHRPSLIGGLRIQVGSDVYDGSVMGRLAQLNERF